MTGTFWEGLWLSVVELEEGLAPTAGVVFPMQVEVGQNVQEHHHRARVREDRGHRFDLKKGTTHTF